MSQIRIVYIIGSLQAGGAERQLLELLGNIDRRRFEPYLVLLEGAGGCEHGLIVDVFDLGLSCEANSRWMRKGPKLTRGLWSLLRYLRRVKPHIVQAILPASNILAAAAAAISPVPVLIGSRRSLAGAYRRTQLLSALDQKAARRCDIMLGNSEAVARELIELDGISSSRVIRIPNGVDTQRFRPGDRLERRRYGWTEEHVVFGIVANFLPYKRHIDFILAAERIVNVNRNARFLMVGHDRGPLKALKTEIRNKRLESLFTILPGVREPEKVYGVMDVYICTSETEGLSNVLLEAGASSLPIVATRVGGNPEIVLHNHNGLLVECHSPESVASAAIQLGENPSLRCEMGIRSRKRVIADFSIRAMVSAHELLYERLLDPSSAAANIQEDLAGIELPVASQ